MSQGPPSHEGPEEEGQQEGDARGYRTPPYPPPYGAEAPYGAPPAYGAPPPFGSSQTHGEPHSYGQPPPFSPPPGYDPYAQQQATPFGAPLAGWWRRAGGFVVDGLLIAVVAIVLEVSFRHHVYLGVVLGEVAQLAYLVLMIGKRGQTLGMMLAGIRLHDLSTGSTSIGYPKALVRALVALVITLPSSFGTPFAAILPLVNYLWPIWDPKNQTWHDKVAATVALRA